MIASFWETKWDTSPQAVVSSPSMKGYRQASGHTAQKEGKVAVGRASREPKLSTPVQQEPSTSYCHSGGAQVGEGATATLLSRSGETAA